MTGLQRVDLVESVAGRGGVGAGDARAAEPLGRQADGAGQGVDRQVAQAIGPQRLGQALAKSGQVPAQLRLLMNVRVARLVGCPF